MTGSTRAFRWWPLLVLVGAAAAYAGLLVVSSGASADALAFEAFVAGIAAFAVVELLIAAPCELLDAGPRWAGRVRMIVGVVIIVLFFVPPITHLLAGSRREFVGFSVVSVGCYLLGWGVTLAERDRSRRRKRR